MCLSAYILYVWKTQFVQKGRSLSSAAFLAYAFVEAYYQSAICLIPLDSFTVWCSETGDFVFQMGWNASFLKNKLALNTDPVFKEKLNNNKT